MGPAFLITSLISRVYTLENEGPYSNFRSSINKTLCLGSCSLSTDFLILQMKHIKLMNPSSTATDQDPNLDEYSPSATLIPFDRPLPLLRLPVAASRRDNPAAGPFVLAFKDLNSWDSTFRACQSKIVAQCEEGTRIGCAVSASNKCAPPWWAPIVGRKVDLKEREECEVREMKECVVAGKEKCIGFAREKCLKPFIGARIGVGGRKLMLTENLAKDIICRVSMPNQSSKFDLSGLFISSMEDYWVTNVKATELLGFDANVGENGGSKQNLF